MLKRILAVGALVALTGCATHQQANTAVGAGMGAVVGHAIGGQGGAVVGAVVGTAIGSQHPVHAPPVYGYPVPVYVIPDRRAQCQIYNERIYNCGRLYDPIHRNRCWTSETQRYNHCMNQ